MTAADVGLTSDEYKALVEQLGRLPNDLELGLVGALWSEHCSYKSSKSVLRWLASESDRVVQGPGDNAGVVRLNDAWEVAFKVESHNHPSFVEPFQGAATGVGGIIRDVLAMGAEPVALLDSLHFGFDAQSQRLQDRVVEGIAFYGNAVGVPTVGGEVSYADAYATNPLVNVMCVGMRPATRRISAAARRPGDRILLVGAKTGRDGIHGASLLASRQFDDQHHDLRPQVQVGDPFLGKLLIEAVLAALATGVVTAVQDLGAAGLTSSSAEMASQGGCGIRLDVSSVSRREDSMTAYEVMLSESQERMLLAVPADQVAVVLNAIRRYELDVHDIGMVTDTGLLEVMEGPTLLASLPARLLTHGYLLRPEPERPESLREDHAWLPSGDMVAEEGLQVLAHPECRSRKPIFSQYDFMVKTLTAQAPGGDAAVLRWRQSETGIALVVDGQARWAVGDPYSGGARAVLEAAMNLTVSGAEPVGLSDGLNLGSPEDPAVYRQFVGLVAGIADASSALNIPVTGGNVSFYNQTGMRSIWPTPVIGALGAHPRPECPVRIGLCEPGLILYRVGWPEPDLSATVWRLAAGDGQVGLARRPNWSQARAVLSFLHQAIDQKWVAAAHDISDGGLFVTLAEMVLNAAPAARRVQVRLPEESMRGQLFNEGPGQAVIAVRPDHIDAVERLASDEHVPFVRLGDNRERGEEGLLIIGDGHFWAWSWDSLREAWEGVSHV